VPFTEFYRGGVSLDHASVAIIPWLRSSFSEFIVGLWQQGTLHRCANYSRASIEKLGIKDECAALAVRHKQSRLKMRPNRAGEIPLQKAFWDIRVKLPFATANITEKRIAIVRVVGVPQR
jgi:hypothetical protein